MRIPQRSTPKYSTKCIDAELMYLDTSLQIIIVEVIDNDMSHHIMKCDSTKEMWETTEFLTEGTEEVMKNRLISWCLNTKRLSHNPEKRYPQSLRDILSY